MDRLQARQIVLDTCKSAGLTPFQAALVYSQGIQESGYNSNVFQKNNNAFGMKLPRKRKSPYIQGKGSAAPASESFKNDPYNFYAKYASLADSVMDLLHRQAAFNINWNKMKTPEDYIDFNKRTGYFQGSVSVYKNNVASFMAALGTKVETALQEVKKKVTGTKEA